MTKFLVLIATSAILLTSCYSDYGLTTEDYRTVVTIRDTADGMFDNLKTFYIIDTVYHVLGDSTALDDITRAYDAKLIAGVAANFVAMGWDQVTDTTGAPPHTVVRISALKNITVGYYYNYWYPYYGWGYGWGWYYPPYYPSGSYYTYSTGSVLVELDKVELPALPSDSSRMRAIWIGSSNGLLSSTQSNNIPMIADGVRQMFTQSPYLYRNEP